MVADRAVSRFRRERLLWQRHFTCEHFCVWAQSGTEEVSTPQNMPFSWMRGSTQRAEDILAREWVRAALITVATAVPFIVVLVCLQEECLGRTPLFEQAAVTPDLLTMLQEAPHATDLQGAGGGRLSRQWVMQLASAEVRRPEPVRFALAATPTLEASAEEHVWSAYPQSPPIVQSVPPEA